MKMPTLPKLSMVKLSRPKPPQPKRLQATARRAAQPAMDDFDDEPTTRLSSAFIVVLILHIVAVGGIYAFNSIKSQRRTKELTAETSSPAALPDSAATAAAPEASTATAETAKPAVPTPPSVQSNLVSPVSGGRLHKVQSGETLSQLASLYSLPVADLAQANGLESSSKLQVGRALNIPAPRAASSKTTTSEVKKTATAKAAATPEKAKAASNPKTYTVVKGDNPVSIARRLGVSYEALLKLNKISDPRRLRLGQELQIPPKKAN